MFRFPQKSTRRLALLSLFPALLVLSYFSLAHSTDGPRLAAPNPEGAVKRSAPALSTFNDRESFRRWFTWVAEMQFYKLSDQWNPEQRDCAGLVRFAWREALRTHDRQWFQRMGENYDPVAPDVSSNITTTSRGKLFRTASGFSEFADAQSLQIFNAEFVSRDREEAKPGDLLFFHQPWVQKFPFHVMIFIGEPRVASEGAHDWVVYHTGASPIDEGTVKKVRLSVLDGHPQKRWRPVQTNPNFLGFYRLKILTEPSAVAPGQSWEK